MDLFSYASGKVSGIIGDSPSPMHYREQGHRGIPRYPRASGITGDNSPDLFPFPRANTGECIKNETAKDPANAYPTKASIKAAFDQWTADGQPWPPPAGLTSAIADRLIPRRTPQHGKRWR
jgi:hypothetical protein